MPIVRDLIQTVVIGKTPGHQPASLQVHGSIANIMASMEVLDLMEQQFITAAQNDLMARIASGEIDTEQKRKKLLDSYEEELRRKYPSGRICKCRWLRGQDLNLRPSGYEPEYYTAYALFLFDKIAIKKFCAKFRAIYLHLFSCRTECAHSKFIVYRCSLKKRTNTTYPLYS